MLLTTPEAIRTLQRKLYTKAKQEPAYRFYALYDKVWRADILMFAYRLVRANKGSPGVDGMDFEDIEQKMGIDKFLLELAQDLKDKTYHPSPVRRVMIPKADGSQRPLGIPAHSTAFGHSVQRDPATCSTMIRPGQSERSDARFSG